MEQWVKRVRSYQSRAREIISDDVPSGILSEMCPEHITTHVHLNLNRLPDCAAARSEMETFLAARQVEFESWRCGHRQSQKAGRCVALMDSEGQWQQNVPNVARLVREAEVANCKHSMHLKGTAITVGSGDTGKGLFHVGKKQMQGWQRQRCQHFWKPRQAVRTTLQLVDLVSVSLENQDGDWKWNCKGTFALDSGAAVSAAPKPLGDNYPVKIEEPRSYKTARGEPVRDEGSRVLPGRCIVV